MKDYKKMWESLMCDLEDFEKQATAEGAEEEAEAYAAVRIQMQFLEKTLRRQNERIINFCFGGDFGNGAGEGSTITRSVFQHIQHVGMR